VAAVFILSIGIAAIGPESGHQNPPVEYVSVALLLLTYFGSFIIIPILGIRFIYNISLLIYAGRRDNVGVFCAKNLFNPLNFLLFPSLLNRKGLVYRRRCIVALILFIILIALVNYLSTLPGIQLSGTTPITSSPTTPKETSTSTTTTQPLSSPIAKPISIPSNRH